VKVGGIAHTVPTQMSGANIGQWTLPCCQRRLYIFEVVQVMRDSAQRNLPVELMIVSVIDGRIFIGWP